MAVAIFSFGIAVLAGVALGAPETAVALGCFSYVGVLLGKLAVRS